MSKNTFDICGDVIYISRSEWDFVVHATIRDDYVDEIQSVTWGLNSKGYVYNSKYGYLHSYVMKKWYGDDFCNEMKEKGFVIDHMDNDKHNCCIDNFWFLKNSYNKAKGLTFDQENVDKRYIALSIYKDWETELFQIAIFFNYPATLRASNFDKPAVVELAYLLYEGDYRNVIMDALSILMEYKEKYTFTPENVRAIDYHIEGCIGYVFPPEVHEEYLRGQHGHTVAYFHKMAPLKKWTKDLGERYFVIKDRKNQCLYGLET